jgi:hypothetical protein
VSDTSIKDFVEEIGKRFGGESQARVEQERQQAIDAPQQVADMRKRYGLGESSLADRLAQRGVPEAIGKLILGGKMRETQATDLAWKLANGEGKLLTLRSPPGYGKSVAGCWILSEKPGLFVGSTMLAIAPRRDENTHDVPANVLDARMRTCGLLVIDDLGVEHSPSGFAVSRLDAIVTYRWDAGKPTLLTTNLPLADFVERYGARIASRLDGDMLGWQELGGSDLRRADR